MSKLDEGVVLAILTDMIETGINPALRKHGRNIGEFFKFLGNRADLMNLYLANQATRSEVLADEIPWIADNEFDVDRARIRIAARQWTAGRILHRKYGDKLNIEVTQAVDMKAAIEEGRRRAEIVINAPPESKVEALVIPELTCLEELKPVKDLEAYAEKLIATLPLEARPGPEPIDS